MEVIIYPYEGHIAICFPAPDWDIEDVAKKDVPEGIPYLIVEHSTLPVDLLFFEAWQADFSNPDGYGMGYQAWRTEKELEGIGGENEYLD